MRDQPQARALSRALGLGDVSVLLGLFGERSVFPRWIGHLIDSGEARAIGDLRLRYNELVFERV